MFAEQAEKDGFAGIAKLFRATAAELLALCRGLCLCFGKAR